MVDDNETNLTLGPAVPDESSDDEEESFSRPATAATTKQERFEIDAPVRQLHERTKERRIRAAAIFLLFASAVGAVFYVYSNYYDGSSFKIPALLHKSASNDCGDCFTEEEIQQMREQLTPKELITRPDKSGTKVLIKHQFLHLHHMKTGGTSMDSLIRCSAKRLKTLGYDVAHQSIHECGPARYKRCRDGDDRKCQQQIADASVLSFCAPLRDLPAFSWIPAVQAPSLRAANASAMAGGAATTTREDPIHAVTVLRHPVERVWSMYRFKTKFCYECKTLKEVYEIIDNGQGNEKLGGESCASQLENHMTRNLIQHEMEGNVDEIVQQAVDDIKAFFTIVGLTEDLASTRIMAAKVFPWMSETMEGTDLKCELPHANKSPANNRCGANRTHWDLPSHPSEEDAELIRQHNQLDLKVYRAAVRHHRLQKIALGLDVEEEPGSV